MRDNCIGELILRKEAAIMNDGTHIRLDVVRAERGISKRCRCYEVHYELDPGTRLVYCKDCGAIIDPFDALMNISKYHERINNTLDSMMEEAKALDSYKPRLRVIKEIEKKYSGTRNALVPSCPHCGEYFDLKDLLKVGWRSKSLINQIENHSGEAAKMVVPAEPAPKWISVEDSLPSEEGFDKFLVVFERRVGRTVEMARYMNGRLTLLAFEAPDGKITHWMPLPDPPMIRKENGGVYNDKKQGD